MTRFLFAFFLAGLLACAGSDSSDSGFQSARIDDEISNADIIRSPVGDDGSIDPDMAARLQFDETVYHFGTVEQGTVLEHDFPFVNTGQVPLLISDARATCGCTVPSYPKTPILPGESGVISVRFDTENKTGRQDKPVTIIANTFPNTTEVRLIGTVAE